ncbi:MAG: sigma-70 family RNA polymerase sigma factor, partial [Armatimonadetes bacterium]|nr:sigma-70 family RNA polymerase sigma factor [Armatimonadota bacterium]
TRGERERRTVPLSSLGAPETEDASPSVDPERFLPGDHRWAGHWAHPPRRWDETVEERFVSRETVAYIHTVIATLPPTQRQVITLRDVEGWTSDEVCGLLGVTETNQRVLLHRARSRVRSALERYLSGE